MTWLRRSTWPNGSVSTRAPASPGRTAGRWTWWPTRSACPALRPATHAARPGSVSTPMTSRPGWTHDSGSPPPDPTAPQEHTMSGAKPMKDPLDLIDLSSVLTDEEREIQATVARFLADRVRPHIAEWFENAHFARELAPELGKL